MAGPVVVAGLFLALAGLGCFAFWLFFAPDDHPTWCRCRRCEWRTRAKTRRDIRLRRATDRQGRR